MDKKIPESGRLSNLCIRIGLFSLKIRKSSAESGRVGSPAAEVYPESSAQRHSIKSTNWLARKL